MTPLIEFKTVSEEACWMTMVQAALQGGQECDLAIGAADWIVKRARERRGQEYHRNVQDLYSAQMA